MMVEALCSVVVSAWPFEGKGKPCDTYVTWPLKWQREAWMMMNVAHWGCMGNWCVLLTHT